LFCYEQVFSIVPRRFVKIDIRRKRNLTAYGGMVIFFCVFPSFSIKTELIFGTHRKKTTVQKFSLAFLHCCCFVRSFLIQFNLIYLSLWFVVKIMEANRAICFNHVQNRVGVGETIFEQI
jgi:hypothetical protein